MAGVVKGFKMPLDYVLYELSYANVIMLGATLPSPCFDKTKHKAEREDRRRGKSNEEIIDAEDPKNRERVKQFFQNVT